MAQGQPTQVTTVLTTVEWNALIDKVNNATKNCGGGGIQHVTDPHLWSLQDITTIQGALKSGCNTAKFTTPVGPPYLWKQKIIDEIETAIAVGCCNGSCGCGCQTAAGAYMYTAGFVYDHCVCGSLLSVLDQIDAWEALTPGVGGTSLGNSAAYFACI